MATEVMELAKTLVGGREKTAEWLRLNASARHGLPWNEEQSTARATSTEKTVTRVTEAQTPIQPVSPTANATTKVPDWLKTAGLMALSGGSAAGLYSWFAKPTPQPPEIEQPIVQPIDQSGGSLLQYLEDEGFHVGGTP